MRLYILLIAMLLCLKPAFADMEADPLLSKIMIDHLEIREADEGNPLAWEAEAWLGKDLNKLWLKTEGELLKGETEEAELQLLYSRAISSYWDLPTPNRNWAAISLKGLAPYLFEVDASLFIGQSGRTAARLNAEYELLFTQRLILSPEIEMNFYGKDDPELGIESGLSDISTGLRLRYEIRREFAPYIGINWLKQYMTDGDIQDTQLVIGVRAWF
jgi:copper resistance protein B